MKSLPDQHRSRLLFRALLRLGQLRWVAGAGILAAGLLDSSWLHWFGRGADGIAMLGAGILLFNAAVRWVLREALSQSDRFGRLVTLASIEIYFDLGCIALVATWTGGLYSPALQFLVLHMIFASLLQPRNRALAAAAFAIAAMGLALVLSGQGPLDRRDWLLAGSWCFTTIAAVLLTESITHALYRRERSRVRQLERLKALSRRLRAQQKSLIQIEKMAAVGQLASGIAHEINNPLSNMDSVLQLMLRKPETPRPDAIASFREQIQRIHRIIRQLTAFAHPGAGSFELMPVNDIVNSSLQMISLDKRLRGITLECDLAPDAGSARFNPHAMEQVLANLIVNAIDATSQAASPRIGIKTRQESDRCVIEISDNGSGISPEHIDRIFEPFFTTKPIGRGTGLGLSISARLIRDHDGVIDVSSELGKGTTFVIRVPIGQSNGQHPQGGSTRSEIPNKKQSTSA
ncbi:MAG: ATP-binding protein [Planctomycetes bacterium]|nr:ATP-binding protein [Planctomycetota bacterium]